MTASTTQASTRIGKGRNGWEATTTIGLGSNNRMLRIHTGKTQGGMATSFQVVKDMGDGCFSFEMFGDYRVRTEHKGARCTEATVRALHADALSVSDLRMADAATFYAIKDAKKQADDERRAEVLASHAVYRGPDEYALSAQA